MQDPAYQQYTLTEVLGGVDTVGGVLFNVRQYLYSKIVRYEKTR